MLRNIQVWDSTLKELQYRYVGKFIFDRLDFEQKELLPFLNAREYVALSTSISGLSKQHFLSLSIYTTKEKDRKVGTLIVEYSHEKEEEPLSVKELYFI